MRPDHNHLLQADLCNVRVNKASNVQWYEASAEALGNGNLEIRATDKRGWPVRPPFGDGGGSVHGENPTIAVTEFYLTPFVHFEYDDQRESQAYELVPGSVLGFHLTVIDRDTDGENIIDAHYALPAESILESFRQADTFVDGLLVGIQEESVVGADSWARIKASFGE